MVHSKELVPLVFATDGEFGHFFGFHDVTPWNDANTFMVCHRVSDNLMANINRSEETFVDICLIDINGVVKIIDKTNTWNWQQGSRLQWIPSTNTFVYNCRKNGKLFARLYNVDTETFKELNTSIYSISKNGKYALTYNFDRLYFYWDAYGYACEKKTDNIQVPSPKDDGIFLIDLESGKSTLLVSIFDTSNYFENYNIDFPKFLVHATFSPDSNRVCFFQRFHTMEGALYSNFFTINIDGTGLKLQGEGKQSHFDWVDNDNILIWSRSSVSSVTKFQKKGLFSLPGLKQLVRIARKILPASFKSNLTNEYFRIINVNTSEKNAFAKGIISEDGHPMFSPDRKWFVCDTYPNKSGIQTLFLYNMEKNERIDIKELFSPEPYWDLGLKCDLHPRWDKTGTKICVDTAVSGKRQINVYDVSSIINK